jgi:hypothetical protein
MIYFIESEHYIYIGHTNQKLRKRIDGHKRRCKDFINERKLGKGKKIKITKSIIPILEGKWKAYVYDNDGDLKSEQNYIKNLVTFKSIVNRYDFLILLQQIIKPDFNAKEHPSHIS